MEKLKQGEQAMISQSLQRQFRLWTIFMIVVPSLFIMAIYTVHQIKAAKQQNLELISQRVEAQQRLIDYWIAERATNVRDLSYSEVFKGSNEQQMSNTLHAALQSNSKFASLQFVDKEGIIRISTIEGYPQQTSVRDRPYFQAALAGRSYVSDIIKGRLSGTLIMALASPVFDYDGNFQGAILGTVSTTTLETLLQDNWIGQTGEVFLVNSEGTMITEPRYVKVLIDKGQVRDTAKMNFKITDDAFSKINLSGTGTATWMDYLGDKVLGAYRIMPDRGWTIIGKIKEEEVLAPLYTQLKLMAGGTVLVLMLIYPLATLITSRVKRPIEWLIGQSELVAKEDYSTIGHDRLSDKMPKELSNLCDTFTRMSRKIENTVGLLKENEIKLECKVNEIQDINATLEEEIAERQATEEALYSLNAELEQRVSARTVDLQDMNATLEEEIAERQAAQLELRQLNAELESKVRDRTLELQEINATLEEEISERKAAQEALQENRERYEALLKQSSEAIVIIDFDTKRVVEMNDAFLRMFGYQAEVVMDSTVADLDLVDRDKIALMDKALVRKGSWVSKLRRYRQKSGQPIYAEMAASLIHYRGKALKILSYRDVTEQQRLQAEIQSQVELAGVVQRSLLPNDYQDDKVTIRAIYQPLTMVSGDFYGYRWSQDGKILNGYLIDVTGHGIATALHTSAISTMMNEVMNEEQPWTVARLTELNRHLITYFPNDAFAAFIGFTLDLENRQLTCISGGINYVLVSTQDRTGLVTIPGIYLGVTETPEFDTMVFPIQHGDTFYFMTDGFYEDLPKEIVDSVSLFEDAFAGLKRFTKGKLRDDCSALCIEIRDLKPVPVIFDYSDAVERRRVQRRIDEVLYELIGERGSKTEVAFGEALMNAVKHGTNIRVKINKIGHRLVLRVKNDGSCFAGNERIKKFEKVGLDQVFEDLLEAGGGRGIPIMMYWTDKLIYNESGTEVMLVKYLP